jgi:hypothetical protein
MPGRAIFSQVGQAARKMQIEDNAECAQFCFY